MNKAVYWATLGLAMLLTACAGQPADRSGSSTPDGYRWYTAGNGVGSFLVPHGWHTREDSRDGTRALYITRENIGVQGRFEVGLTVNRVSNFTRTSSVPVSEYAKSFIDQLSASNDVLESDTIERDGDTLHRVRVRLADAPDTLVQYITLGRPETDDLFLLYFEAPASEGDEAFETARPILETFRLGS